MKNNDVKQLILDFMRSKSYAPMNAEELLAAIVIPDKALPIFWASLTELESNGDIVKTRFLTYGLPERMGLVVGRFQLTSKGFGFVIPDNKKADGEDVFIPPGALGGAMNNDRVVARVEVRASGKKQEGNIIRIIKRANDKVVGVFIRSGDFGFVVPDDKKIGPDIYIGKKNFAAAKSEQKVVAQIISWPDGRKSAEGKIVEILGNPGDVGLEILSIIKQNDLPLQFPEEVLAAAEQVPLAIKEEDLKGRKDLRNLSLITIDGADAKDLDDAVYMKKKGKDFLLSVHIADVSHYVREGAPLDVEARSRGTSVYLVDRVIPMLPERLSNGICSLNAGEDRLAMSCEMLIDAEGKVKAYEIFPSVIRVLYRMNYGEVRDILEHDDKPLQERYTEIVPMLKLMEELCLILRRKRVKRGAIDFDLPEQKVILDESGRPVEIVQRVRSIAESVIEEFMLAANETVAAHMSKAQWPFIYRVHDLPNPEKLFNLAKLLQNFNVRMPVSEEPKPVEVQLALNEMAGRPEERLVSTVALRSLKQAVYQAENIGHFGLAAEYYTHFTSPIRRYPDLIVHRLLHAWLKRPQLGEKRREQLEQELDEIALASSQRERAAAEAERATVDLKMAEYMSERIGEEYEGTISGVTAFGFFVELGNGVEGLVHISGLSDDYYEFKEDSYALVGEHTGKVFRLGDSVKIEVLQVSIKDRTIDFILAGESEKMRTHIIGLLSGRRESGAGKRGKQEPSKTASTGKPRETSNKPFADKKRRPKKRDSKGKNRK